MGKKLKRFLLFDDREIDNYIEFDDETLGYLFKCVMRYHKGETKESILAEIDNNLTRCIVKNLFNNQDARREEYEKKCARYKENADKRWENKKNDEDLQKQIASIAPEDREVIETYAKYIEEPGNAIIDMIQTAVKNYSASWVKDAILEAVKANVRNWKYIEGILSHWKSWGGKQDPKRSTDNSNHESIYANLYQQ